MGSSHVKSPRLPRQRFGGWAVAAAMLLTAVLGLTGLSNHPFWDDEANTAIYGRNLLKFGRMTAWDGRNLIGYAHGGALGEDLGKELRVPALPACVAALGMRLAGETTFGGRVMFVVAGIASVGLLAFWMRRLLGRRFPWYLPSLILALSPAHLLYLRNCRYYALGVTFTLLLWIIWTPSRSRGRRLDGPWFDGRSVFRYAAGALVVLLLLGTHYLNAAAALIALPVFFLSRRFRQPRQYLLLGVLGAVSVAYGIWLWLSANPFAADYLTSPDAPLDVRSWTHLRTNFGKLLRDLGTHEFFPLCVLPVLVLPWSAAWTRRLRPWARQGGILVAVALVYVATAAVLTPADMGQGKVAEMRYVVPLIAVGCAAGGLTVGLLWRIARPLGAVVLLLLVGTNLLHLGFLADRDDDTSALWPPTLYRYVAGLFDDYETGTDAMVDLLEQIPDGTTVRIWPPYLVYPAMFYQPGKYYCDQLTESKRIRPDLRDELPNYLFVEWSRAEVVLVAVPEVRQKLAELYFTRGPESHELTKVTAPYWNFTTKPEIPAHFFSAPEKDGVAFPGMAVAVEEDSPASYNPAVQTDLDDADAVCRLGAALLGAGNQEDGVRLLKRALQIDSEHPRAHDTLGQLWMEEQDNALAAKHLLAAVRTDQHNWGARLNLGIVMRRLGKNADARRFYREALNLKPDCAAAHYNLGYLDRIQNRPDEAIAHFKEALKISPHYAEVHVNWAEILTKRNHLDEAIEHYREALRLQPNLVYAQVGLGVVLHAMGEKEKGIAEVQAALRRVPADSPLADDIRARLRRLQGKRKAVGSG